MGLEINSITPARSEPASTPNTQKLREASETLEAQFLAEMLKASGFGKTPDFFGGGSGEDQFTSFLVEAQSKRIVEAGGIGLAEQIFNSLRTQSDGTA
ncbi:rod-binding protein [Celeribacter litoreus]|uniref:rod-binding protein n=1 Tax=Celeribacter litoreus TaxID=2876714 RepID=UPI001CCA7346|nr:rod-binding protein [Celeribacter litoreus]MCA0044249.1 rod-binding protein [Celeribacter litoreus]